MRSIGRSLVVVALASLALGCSSKKAKADAEEETAGAETSAREAASAAPKTPKPKPTLSVRDASSYAAKAPEIGCGKCASAVRLDDNLAVTLAFQSKDGDVVDVGGQQAKVEGGEAKLTIAMLPYLAKIPLDDLVRGVPLPVTITPASPDFEKLETTIELDGEKLLIATYQAAARMPITFPGDKAAPSEPHVLGIWYYKHPERLGNARTLADVDLVALENFDTRHVGSCSYGAADGSSHVVPLLANDRIDKVYDRRTGKLKAERRFTAPPAVCSATIAASDTSVDSFADRDEVMKWRGTLIHIVPLDEGPNVAAATSAEPAASDTTTPTADPPPAATPTPIAANAPIAPTNHVDAQPTPPPTAAPPPAPTPTPKPASTSKRPRLPVLRK